MSKYLDADARLEIAGQDTHLCVDGDLTIATDTAGIFSLTGGTLEVKGNLRETEKFSFASSESFTAAFLGEGPHLVDIESAPHSGFTNIDSRYGSYTLAGSPLDIFGRGAYSIFVGVIEGLIELSQIEEMSETTLLLLKEKVSPEALEALAAAMKEYGKKQLRRVVEAVEKVYDNTKEVLTKECVPKLLKEIRECEDSLNDAVERVVRWIRGGKLTIIEGEYSYSEINAAKYMASKGNDVILMILLCCLNRR